MRKSECRWDENESLSDSVHITFLTFFGRGGGWFFFLGVGGGPFTVQLKTILGGSNGPFFWCKKRKS